jgi:hypothetical protein
VLSHQLSQYLVLGDVLCGGYGLSISLRAPSLSIRVWSLYLTRKDKSKEVSPPFLEHSLNIFSRFENEGLEFRKVIFSASEAIPSDTVFGSIEVVGGYGPEVEKVLEAIINTGYYFYV